MDEQQEQRRGEHRHERYAMGERPRRDYDERNPAHSGYGQMGFASDEEEHSGDLHEEGRGRRREDVREEDRGADARAGHSFGGGEARRRQDESGYPAGGRSYAQYGAGHERREEPGRGLGSSYGTTYGGPEGRRNETPAEPMDEAGYGGYGEPGMAAANRPVSPQSGEPRRAETLRGGTYETYPGTIQSGGGRGASSRPSRSEPGARAGEGERDEPRGQYDLAGGYRRGHVRDRRGPKNYSRPDDRVRDEVCERLIHDTDVDLGEVEVEVREGEVHLSGSVGDRREKHLIEDVADGVWGVKEIHNGIRIVRDGGRTGGQ